MSTLVTFLKEDVMGLRDLSEAIILQSASDLLGKPSDEETLQFFTGEGFRICAEMAKLSHDDKLNFLNMLVDSISACKETKPCRETAARGSKKAIRKWSVSHKVRKNAVMNAV
jgi:hypothetical protein